MLVYRACIISVLLYDSESWTTYARQEDKLQSFHLRNLRFIFSSKRDEIKTNVEVLDIAGLPSIYTLVRQRRLRWLSHVHRIKMVESQKISFMESLQKVKDQQGVPSKDSQMYVRGIWNPKTLKWILGRPLPLTELHEEELLYISLLLEKQNRKKNALRNAQ